MTEAVQTAEKATRRQVGRSPAYPFIPVQKALEQAAALHAQEGDYAAPLASAVKAWGYSPKSSGGRQTLATMKYYGLIEITGEGDQRKVKVSDTARRILLDRREDETEKKRLIRSVALTPAAHKAIYDHYPNGLASDGSVEHFLIWDMGYNPDAARELLVEFKLTASHVGLFQPSGNLDNVRENGVDRANETELPVAKVGDRIQCTIDGIDVFPNGATVLGFSDDGDWVFTDQSSAGSPMKGITVLEAATLPEQTPVQNPPQRPAHLAPELKRDEAPKPEQRKAIFPVSDGDVVLEFPEGISAASLKTLGKYLNIFLEEEIEKKSPA
jgi:hypothetical protein